MTNPYELAVKLYRGIDRRRHVPLDDEDTPRHLNHLLQAREGSRLAYHDVLERLADFGVNVLRPRLREAPKPLEMWIDEVTKSPLPSPFGTERERELKRMVATLNADDPGKAKAQQELASIREEQIAISRSHPDLADHLQKMAESPWQYQIALREAEGERQAQNHREEGYFANARKAHDNDDWIREWVGDDVEKAKIANRESQPINLGAILGRRQDQHRSLVSRIAKEDPTLFAVVLAAQAREKAWAEEQHAIAQEAQRERVLAAQELANALRDARVGVERTSDGRVITNAAAGASKR